MTATTPKTPAQSAKPGDESKAEETQHQPTASSAAQPTSGTESTENA